MSDNPDMSNLASEVLDNINYIREVLEESSINTRDNRPQKGKQESEIEDQLTRIYSILEKEIGTKNSVRKQLCVALNGIASDTFDIAKSIVPTLIALSLSKTLSIQVEPLAIALAAIAIARMGANVLCADSGG